MSETSSARSAPVYTQISLGLCGAGWRPLTLPKGGFQGWLPVEDEA